MYEWLRIKGSYRGEDGIFKDGFFEYTKDVNGNITHRYFNTK
jgi:hypothetical protein